MTRKHIAHRIQKTEPKSFQCNICEKNCSTKSNLSNHVNLHTQSFLCIHKALANNIPCRCTCIRISVNICTNARSVRNPLLRTESLTWSRDCAIRVDRGSSNTAHRHKHPENHPPSSLLILSERESNEVRFKHFSSARYNSSEPRNEFTMLRTIDVYSNIKREW